MRPKYLTRKGRTVYGGGGITPDKYIPYSTKTTNAVQKIIGHNKRPLFNWASSYTEKYQLDKGFNDYRIFKNKWKLPQEHHTSFLQYLETEGIKADTVYTESEIEMLTLRIKAEIAGVVWGRNEATGVRLMEDNQVQEGIKFFDEASVFINHSF